MKRILIVAAGSLGVAGLATAAPAAAQPDVTFDCSPSVTCTISPGGFLGGILTTFDGPQNPDSFVGGIARTPGEFVGGILTTFDGPQNPDSFLGGIASTFPSISTEPAE